MPSPIHDSRYSAEQLRRLENFNRLVPLYLWIGLLAILGSAAASHAYAMIHNANRRARVRRFLLTGEAPVKGCSRTGKSCTRWVPSCLISILRKWTIRKSPLLSRFYIANVAQLIVLALYFGLNIGLMLGGAHNDISWVAHHAARLACANLPLVIGLASKNNFVSYATGLSCQSLNVFHRWSARMVFLLSLVHVGGRIHIAEPSVSTSGAGQGYIRWGVVALVGFAWMTFASARYLRNLAYSIFITGHVLVLLVLFTATWIHRPQMKGWILAGLGVYLIDRSWRFARVVKYLYVAYVPKDITRAFVAVLAEDTIRVTVRTKAQWVPGQHVYLHCPSLSLGGHPFTISSVSEHGDRPVSEQELIVRVQKGLTLQLYQLAKGQAGTESQQVEVDAWTEGPYGSLLRFGEEYQTLLLVAGGAGVSFTLPVMLDIVRRANLMQGQPDQAVLTERLTFVWIVRNEQQISWISDHLRHAASLAPPGLLRIKIYCTGKTTVPDPAASEFPPSLSGTSKESPPWPKESPPWAKDIFEILYGRPRFDEVIESEVQGSHYTDWVAVGACGPAPMTRDLANAVSRAIQPRKVLRGEHRRNIRLDVESFGW